MAFDFKLAEKAIRDLLEAIGEDADRPGLRDTPRRVVNLYREITSGYEVNPADHLQMLPGEDHDEIVLVKDIPFYSLCEHHLAPFIGLAHVAYLPDGGRVCGLSKFARVVESYSRRLQMQERLTTQIAQAIQDQLEPRGVMVVLEAEHLCMTMRGVKKPGARTVTSVVRGLFRENPATRAETLQLIWGAGR